MENGKVARLHWINSSKSYLIDFSYTFMAKTEESLLRFTLD